MINKINNQLISALIGVKKVWQIFSGHTWRVRSVRHSAAQSPFRQVTYGQMSFPARSRYVGYNRLSPLGPVSSIHSSNPFQIQLPRNSEPYKTRQVESPRAEGLHTFAKSSLDPTQFNCEFFHGSPHVMKYMQIQAPDSPMLLQCSETPPKTSSCSSHALGLCADMPSMIIPNSEAAHHNPRCF